MALWNTVASTLLAVLLLICSTSNYAFSTDILLVENATIDETLKDNLIIANRKAKIQRAGFADTCKLCTDTKGTCEYESGEFICKCPEDGLYSTYYGCQVADTDCETAVPGCIKAKGICVFEEGIIKCECPGEARYTTDKGCVVNETVCDEEYPKCRETGGTCFYDSNGQILNCKCSEDMAYKISSGCVDIKDECDSILPYCGASGGYCNFMYAEVECICPFRTSYRKFRGCSVSDEICEDYQPRCEQTGGSCYLDNAVQCRCPENSKYVQKIGCKDKCFDMNCQNGGRCAVEKGEAVCKCTDEFTGKNCETLDLCKKKCGDNTGVICFGNGTFEKTIKCGCLRANEIFEENGKFCKDPCEYDPCRNGGVCLVYKNKFECICKNSFEGDRCEIKKIDDTSSVPKVTWILCSIIVLLILIAGALLISRCRINAKSQIMVC